jgi:3-hydroxyisobutyrate dehydrogenase
MSEQVLGFVGLGRMGGPMAARLIAAGHQLVGFDVAGTLERLPDGGVSATSVADLAGKADIVFLSVPDGAASMQVCAGIAAAEGRRTRIVVDLSTIGIVAARECAEILGAADATYIDAPVSGGIAGATNGTLALMAGAPEAAYAEVEPLLAILAKNCFRVGDSAGQGQAMKLLNNYVSAAALAATCEATVFGARMGLDMQTMVDVLNVSSGRSAASQDKFPRSIVPRTYDFGFAGALMTKDVTLYHENASGAAVPHDLAGTVARVWQQFNAAHPDADFTYLHRYLEGSAE